MALSVGTDLAALLMAASPEAGPRRAAASAVTPQTTAMPQGFADLLASLPQGYAAPNTEPVPPSARVAQPIAASPANGPRGGAPVVTEWPWASLAAAAEEADALAGQFQLPPSSTAMPAGDAALPEEREPSTALELPPATPPVPFLVMPPLESAQPGPALIVAPPVLAAPLELSPAPSAEPAAAASPFAPQAPTAEPAAAPALPQPVAAAPAPLEAAAWPDMAPADSMPPASAKPLKPSAVLASSGLDRPAAVVPEAAEAVAPARTVTLLGPLPGAPAAALAEAPLAAPVLKQQVAGMPPPLPSQPIDSRRSSRPGPAPSVAPASAGGETRLPWTASAVPASDVMSAEWPAAVDVGAAPLSPPDHSALAPKATAIAETEAGSAGGTLDVAMPPTTPAAVAPELRSETPRAAHAAGPAMPRPHLPPEAGQQLALRVVTAAANRVESVSVDLRPPELGKVELRLTFHDGTVQVSMAAERGDTFEALRQDRAHLEQQIQQAGLQLGGSGLDLQHGHLPREAPEPPPNLPARADSNEAAEEEPDAPRPPPSDSLIDLIA